MAIVDLPEALAARGNIGDGELRKVTPMRIEGQRRSEKFEDRGQSGGGGGAGAGQGLMQVVRLLGVKGTLIAAVVLGGVYLLAPAGLKASLMQALLGGGEQSGSPSAGTGQGACAVSKTNEQACDFSRVVLASTEDVWSERFSQSALPGGQASAYVKPTLVVFTDNVSTGGCGSATSGVGPFYCPGDSKLYIDPTFYQLMESKLKAPGDFAQAYVIAHEVGHHVQNLIGSSRKQLSGETKNQTSVRVELQADCFAGVWGQAAKSALNITEEDLGEALTAAHAIGDDTLGNVDKTRFTHGSSEQRKRWFRRGFDGGDARNCDTFAESSYARL